MPNARGRRAWGPADQRPPALPALRQTAERWRARAPTAGRRAPGRRALARTPPAPVGRAGCSLPGLQVAGGEAARSTRPPPSPHGTVSRFTRACSQPPAGAPLGCGCCSVLLAAAQAHRWPGAGASPRGARKRRPRGPWLAAGRSLAPLPAKEHGAGADEAEGSTRERQQSGGARAGNLHARRQRARRPHVSSPLRASRPVSRLLFPRGHRVGRKQIYMRRWLAEKKNLACLLEGGGTVEQGAVLPRPRALTWQDMNDHQRGETVLGGEQTAVRWCVVWRGVQWCGVQRAVQSVQQRMGAPGAARADGAPRAPLRRPGRVLGSRRCGPSLGGVLAARGAALGGVRHQAHVLHLGRLLRGGSSRGGLG